MISAGKVEALYESSLGMLERVRSRKRPLRRYLIVEWLVSYGLEGMVAVCDVDCKREFSFDSFSMVCHQTARQIFYKAVPVGQFLKEFVLSRNLQNSTNRMRELEIWIILGCLFQWPISLLEDWSDQLAIEYSVCRREDDDGETDRIPGGITADLVDSLKRHCALFDVNTAMNDWLFAVTSVLGLGDVYQNSESDSESDSDCFDSDQKVYSIGNRRSSVIDLCDGGVLAEDKQQHGNLRNIRHGGPLKNHVQSEVSTVVVSTNFVNGANNRSNQTKPVVSLPITRRKSVKKFFVLSTPPKPSAAASGDLLPSSSISSLPSLERLSFDNL